MLIASRATAGPTPRCIHCGAEGRYIDLNASWQSRCEHFSSDLTTETALDAAVHHAREALAKARERRRAFRALLIQQRDSDG